ncbi:unnamed protein product [Angiostrongylus costaricensis]|uniref:DUF222 domain-containing protein n=1 Tax=Angiostrongylus costaricensis TaxID=334426 RepID=A0A0R3PVV2_ANGCS|nr:unnamed protein product [Angiostrongylus costaricensis]
MILGNAERSGDGKSPSRFTHDVAVMLSARGLVTPTRSPRPRRVTRLHRVAVDADRILMPSRGGELFIVRATALRPHGSVPALASCRENIPMRADKQYGWER